VTVTHDFADAATAQKFIDGADLHEAMKNAGVAGPPEMWITEQA
jgi:hypothetical protein